MNGTNEEARHITNNTAPELVLDGILSVYNDIFKLGLS